MAEGRGKIIFRIEYVFSCGPIRSPCYWAKITSIYFPQKFKYFQLLETLPKFFYIHLPDLSRLIQDPNA
jgi:hypothetical protein